MVNKVAMKRKGKRMRNGNTDRARDSGWVLGSEGRVPEFHKKNTNFATSSCGEGSDF